MLTIGSEKTRDMLELNGTTQETFAKELGIARQQLNAILNGHRLPTLRQAVRIEKLTGVKCCDWIEKTRRHR